MLRVTLAPASTRVRIGWVSRSGYRPSRTLDHGQTFRKVPRLDEFLDQLGVLHRPHAVVDTAGS